MLRMSVRPCSQLRRIQYLERYIIIFMNVRSYAHGIAKSKGLFPSTAETSEHGELRTMTQLVLDICEVCHLNLTPV
jgi:hypothetical protein